MVEFESTGRGSAYINRSPVEKLPVEYVEVASAAHASLSPIYVYVAHRCWFETPALPSADVGIGVGTSADM